MTILYIQLFGEDVDVEDSLAQCEKEDVEYSIIFSCSICIMIGYY